jgi:hypothetical protein
MLSLSESRKRPVVIARPQKPSLKDGFCGLGGHAPEGGGCGRAGGARFVPIVNPLPRPSRINLYLPVERLMRLGRFYDPG